jgi:hypothetical protein
MGTTLTGTTPQDTYDSLIKVTDNGPISGTAKYLSDGLGNDSVLALSTTAVGVGTASPSTYGANLAVLGSGNGIISIGQATSFSTLQSNGQDFYINAKGTGNLIFRNGSGDTERMRITGAGNVGIGTAAPTAGLAVAKSGSLFSAGSQYYQPSGNVFSSLGLAVSNQDNWFGMLGNYDSSSGSAGLLLQANFRDVGSQAGHFISSKATALGLSDLVIGKLVTTTGSSTPPNLVEQARFLSGGGLTFNGDTAAANALDDYEEGTWTMGVEFGGAAVGVTYGSNTGTYTKIGRQVTVNGFLALTSKGSSTGRAKITGLPFTIPNNVANYGAASLWFNAITFANQLLANGVINETTIELEEITEAGVRTGITEADFANNTSMIVNFTYFV